MEPPRQRGHVVRHDRGPAVIPAVIPAVSHPRVLMCNSHAMSAPITSNASSTARHPIRGMSGCRLLMPLAYLPRPALTCLDRRFVLDNSSS